MIRIDSLVIQNFKKFGEETIPFNQKTNIIVGDNESGKSTLLEAIEICLNCTIHGRPLTTEELSVGLFNYDCVEEFLEKVRHNIHTDFPKILIEAYISGLPEHYRGSQNSRDQDTTGVKVEIEMDPKNDEEFQEIFNKIDTDVSNSLPIEFYKVKWESFGNMKVLDIDNEGPLPHIFVELDNFDPAINKNKYINKILKENLNNEDISDLNYSFRQKISQFDEKFGILNKNLDLNNEITSKNLKITTDFIPNTALEDSLQLKVDEIPFAHIGKGEQNQIQVKLSLHNIKKEESVKIVLIDEIENHLSHMSLTKLIDYIENFGSKKQLFITTHSSYVLNKLSIDNLLLLGKRNHTPLKNLNKRTKNKILGLPGYDTLRIVLTNKAILVEGPSDELMVKKYFMQKFGKLPEQMGIEVIVVHGLGFKSYLDIAELIGTNTVVLIDNDGNYERNVKKRFEKYNDCPNIKIFATVDDNLFTIEPTLINANSSNIRDLDNFASIALTKHLYAKYLNEKNIRTKCKYLEDFFERNTNRKVDIALRFFLESKKSIKFPKHLEEAIDHVQQNHS